MDSCLSLNSKTYHVGMTVRQVCANTVDPDKTAPKGPKQSNLGLHCLPFCLHLSDALLYGKTMMFIFFFYLGFTACQDYFTHFELSQPLGGSKTGDPRENHLTTHKRNLACLIWPELGSNPQRWYDERLHCSKFRVITPIFSDIQIFRSFRKNFSQHLQFPPWWLHKYPASSVWTSGNL